MFNNVTIIVPNVIKFPGFMQMGVERAKKLQTGKISQLETCVERCSDHVCHVENWKNGKIHERFRSEILLHFIKRSLDLFRIWINYNVNSLF